MALQVAVGRATEGYSKEVVDGTSSANIAHGVSQVGAPVADGPYQATAEGKALGVLELILQELRTLTALTLAQNRPGGGQTDMDLMKNTY